MAMSDKFLGFERLEWFIWFISVAPMATIFLVITNWNECPAIPLAKWYAVFGVLVALIAASWMMMAHSNSVANTKAPKDFVTAPNRAKFFGNLLMFTYAIWGAALVFSNMEYVSSECQGDACQMSNATSGPAAPSDGEEYCATIVFMGGAFIPTIINLVLPLITLLCWLPCCRASTQTTEATPLKSQPFQDTNSNKLPGPSK